MSDKPLFTQAMFKEFDELTWLACDYDQVKRIDGRLQLNAFIEKHGREVCDVMYRLLLDDPRKARGKSDG